MIIGIGMDIIQINRIREAIEKTPRFVERLFCSEEIEYCKNMAKPERHYAARFAAKEAVMKALGTGWSRGIRFQDIVITNDEKQKPSLSIREPTSNNIPDIDKMKFWITLTHDGDIAAATVVIEME